MKSAQGTRVFILIPCVKDWLTSLSSQVECDSSFCTLERQESMDVSTTALEMMAGAHDPLAVQDLGQQIARRMSIQKDNAASAGKPNSNSNHGNTAGNHGNSASNSKHNGKLPNGSTSSKSSSNGGASPISICSYEGVPSCNLNHDKSSGYYSSNTQYDGGTLVQRTELSAFGNTTVSKEKSSLSDSIKKQFSMW